MTMRTHETVLLTGATGLLGRDVFARLLAEHPALRFTVLVRDRAAWALTASGIPGASERVTALVSDLQSDSLGLTGTLIAQLRHELKAVIHLAADTTFSRSLADARAVNTDGTRRLLELVGSNVRFAYVSTAFVAGRRTGTINEEAGHADAGWVNAYEQSKFEAESLVRSTSANWVIMRPSTVVCDDLCGGVSQFNVAHRALRLYRDGLAAMMPGVSGSTVDTVTTAYVGRAIAALALNDAARGQTFHLCAGTHALSLAQMLDMTYARWAADPAWRRRGIERPLLADLATYALFERTIEDTADASLRRVTRALSHFVPQLGLPKQFDTSRADAMLGFTAPPVAAYWEAMLGNLLATNWGAERRAA
jgi:long-chain acyl-CoA synthetase